MFEPKENPGYEKLANGAAELISKWSSNDWYESSTDGEIAQDRDTVPEDTAPEEGNTASDRDVASDEDITAKGEIVQYSPPS